jgi:hypothetical protein
MSRPRLAAFALAAVLPATPAAAETRTLPEELTLTTLDGEKVRMAKQAAEGG